MMKYFLNIKFGKHLKYYECKKLLTKKYYSGECHEKSIINVFSKPNYKTLQGVFEYRTKTWKWKETRSIRPSVVTQDFQTEIVLRSWEPLVKLCVEQD